MGGFFGLTPIGLEQGPAAPAPVVFNGGSATTFPQDSQPSTLASLGTFFRGIGQTVASTYQAVNAPSVPAPRSASSATAAPSGPSTLSGGFGKLLLYAAIAFAVVFVGIRLFERR